jgi:DNA-binding FadR family transcriptional regulator
VPSLPLPLPVLAIPTPGPVERAHRHLLDILDQTPEGCRLPSERAVAAALCISRQSARAAFRRLRESGRVDRIVGSGSFVRPSAQGSAAADASVPDAGILDVLEARHVLEPVVAALATSRAMGEDFVRIRQKLSSLQSATEPRDYKQAGYAFWQEVARATRNPLLVAMYHMLIECRARLGWDQLKGITMDADKRAAQLRLAEEIYDALQARNRERAHSLASERTRNMLLAAADLETNSVKSWWVSADVPDPADRE